MSHIATSLAQAIYSRLKDDATIQSLLGGDPPRVYDESVPDETAYPYVLFDIEFQNFGSHTFDGFSGFIQFDVFDEARSKAEMYSIQNRIYDLFHDYDPAIAGFPTINLEETLRRDEKFPDSRTYQGTQRFNFTFSGNET